MGTRVLYLSNFHEESGYSQAARDYILAMDRVDIDVVPRRLRITGRDGEVPERIKELEAKSTAGCDTVIQHTLPSFMDYNGSMRNIALFASESSTLRHSGWLKRLNCMDEIWVINQQMKESLIGDMQKEISVVPHTFDMDIFCRKWEPLPQIQALREQGDFVFYTIGEFVRRKNFEALIGAFLTEFEEHEPVKLVIKTNKSGLSPQECSEEVKTFVENAKKYLKLPRKKANCIIITDFLRQDDVFRLHNSCDCFVQPSHGEAWCAVPGTMVDTYHGQKPIENLILGDYVYTHDGTKQKITATMSRNFDGEIVSIKAYGLTERLNFTPTHQHYVVKRNGVKCIKDVTIHPEFIECQNIKNGDFLVVPKIKQQINSHNTIKISDFIDVVVDEDGYIICQNSYKFKKEFPLSKIAKKFNCSFQHISKVLNGNGCDTELNRNILKFCENNKITKSNLTKIKNEIELTEDFMFFLGHYIAEGWSSKSLVGLATHINEELGKSISMRAIKEAFGFVASIDSVKINSNKLYFCNKIICQFLKKLCGSGARNKYIHNVLKSSKNINYLIQGLWYGDGCVTDGEFKFSTISRQLTRDIVDICLCQNIIIKQSYDKRGCYNLSCSTTHSERFVNFVKPVKYNCIIRKFKTTNQKQFLEDDANFYIPVRKIERIKYFGPVYNISVDKNETYTVNRIATHNCIPAAHAMGFGKTPVVTDWSGYREYITSETGWPVKYRLEPCVGAIDTMPTLLTGRESWASVDIHHLRQCMREAYSNAKLRKFKAAKGISSIYKFSYEEIGSLIKRALNGETEQVARPAG